MILNNGLRRRLLARLLTRARGRENEIAQQMVLAYGSKLDAMLGDEAQLLLNELTQYRADLATQIADLNADISALG